MIQSTIARSLISRLLLLLTSLIALLSTNNNKCVVNAHFMWAHVTNLPDATITAGYDDTPPIGVEVVFSESSGVPDAHAIQEMLDDYTEGMTHMTHTCCCKSFDFTLSLNEPTKDALEGVFFPPDEMVNCSALASGHFDFGPYAPIHARDVQFSFAAQIYQKYSGFDDFFAPLMEKATYPSIVLRNCGGGNVGMSYQFAVGGFPAGNTLNVCLYYQGGIPIHCGTFDIPAGDNNMAPSLSYTIGPSSDEQYPMMIIQQDQPVLVYALANMTVTKNYDLVGKNDGSQILFATTSVYFEGPCKA